LINHITGGHIATTDNATQSFQPMNINFGLMPPPDDLQLKGVKYADKAIARKRSYTTRAKVDFAAWLAG